MAPSTLSADAIFRGFGLLTNATTGLVLVRFAPVEMRCSKHYCEAVSFSSDNQLLVLGKGGSIQRTWHSAVEILARKPKTHCR